MIRSTIDSCHLIIDSTEKEINLTNIYIYIISRISRIDTKNCKRRRFDHHYHCCCLQLHHHSTSTLHLKMKNYFQSSTLKKSVLKIPGAARASLASLAPRCAQLSQCGYAILSFNHRIQITNILVLDDHRLRLPTACCT